MNYIVRVQKGSRNQDVDIMKLVGFDCTGMPSFVSCRSRIEPMRFSDNVWEKIILDYLTNHWTCLTTKGPSFEYRAKSIENT